jgi:hypothetical protein
MRYLSLGVIAAFCVFALSSCKEGTTDAPSTGNGSSWSALQQKVITPKCTGCHVAGANFATQSGLVLTSDVAYANLINIAAHNLAANTDGLVRVKPGNPTSSFLYLKLHGLPAGKDYGSPMPLGYSPLSVGQLEFIKEWITAGAPDTGVVADAKLLDDTTQSPPPTFTSLPPPNTGQGYQFHLGPFTVNNNFERELFDYMPIGNPMAIYVNRIQTRMRENSHHFLLYTFDPSTPAADIPKFNQIRDLRNPDGSENSSVFASMQWHVFFGGSTTPDFDYYFPTGTALYVAPNTAIDLNSHYINYTGTPIQGEIYANIYTIPQAQVQHVAYTFLNPQTNLNLPAHQQTIVRTDNPNPYTNPMHVFMLTSHTHARGQKFTMIYKGLAGNPRNGEVLYESDDWDHPLIKNFDPPIIFNKGEGITTEVTYYNNTDQTIQFGFTSKDEMDILLGYFYF